ncbi:MAG: ACP S-malonyltransferase [Acidobacteriota bacterium]
MGKALAETFPEARRVFEEADDALGFSLSKLCFEGPEDDLKLTENTQPALVTMSTAAFAVLSNQGLQPRYVAGHSLGEYSALVRGIAAFRRCVRLVRKRGQYMQEAVRQGVGAMAALLKLPPDALDQLLAEAAQGESRHRREPQFPRSSGHRRTRGAVNRAMELGQDRRRETGHRAACQRSVPLPLDGTAPKPASRPIWTPLPSRTCGCPDQQLASRAKFVLVPKAREGLYHQVPNPVRWSDSCCT